MKKLFLNTLLFAMCGMANAQTLTVADVEVLQGGTASFVLTVEDASDYVGLQGELQFPATGFTLTGETTTNSDWKNASISTGALSGGITNMSASSSNNSSIPTGNIELGSIEFKADAGLALGSYDVTLANFEFLSATAGQDKSIANVTFTIKVVDRITLDEESTTLPPTMDGVNVTVKRTIKKDVWNTICLPFNMTTAQYKAAFGDDVKFAQFAGTNGVTNDGEGNYKIKFTNYAADKDLKANTPYLIKTTTDISYFDLDNVDVAPKASPSKSSVNDDEDPLGTMYGTMKAGTVIPKDHFFLSGNKFYYSTGATTIKAFRAYFKLVGFDSSAAPNIGIVVDDENTTNIEGLQIMADDGRIYNLKGQHVENPTEKGVYIKNGKKFVIK